MSISKDNFSFITFDNQKVPEFKQVRGKDWIYWGEKNDYPDYLIDLYMRSSTHNAIITGKVNYILGGGWVSNKVGTTIEQQAILNKFIQEINPDESIDEVSEAIVLDFEIFNAITFEIIFNKAGTDFSIHHIPYNKIRTNEDESKYWYSKDWSQVQQTEEKTGLKEYEPYTFDKSQKKGCYIYVYKITAPRKGKDPNVYPMPEYIGSTQAIETDLECSNYNLSEIKTGFSAGTILNFYNGVPTDDAKREIERKIKEKFSGTDRAGGIILNFADGKDRGSEVVALSGNDLDKRYIELKKDVRQEIFTGHKVSSPMLFGVKTEGQLGGRTEVAEAYELFQNTYISKRQRILEKVFNKFLKLKNIAGSIKLKQVEAIGHGIPDTLIAQAMPIDYVKEKLGIPVPKKEESDVSKHVIDSINSLSPLVANKVLESMTASEIRSLVGLSGGMVTTTTTTKTDTAMSMAKQSSILESFENIGRSKELFVIFKQKEIEHANYFTIKRAEKEYFANELSSNERAIVDLLGKDEKMPASEIAKTLKLTEEEVIVLIAALIAAGFLSAIKTGFKPTELGIATILEEGAKTANVEILYSYELRKSAPALSQGGKSREFCTHLMKLNKLYTRDEIDNLSNGMDLDVWEFKGGWYTNPKTDAPTPQCRHIWVQNVVKLK